MNEQSPKLRLAALLLAICFGILGVHRMYVGKIGSVVAQLVLTLSVFGIFPCSVWLLVDWIKIASGIFEDKQGRIISKWTN